jgi:hypothetical protein
LLQSEGRSAFFTTINANGESVLIRIIECHFDEDEILARWRGVQTLGHSNFLRIDRFGQFLIEEDDITAVYAVFERVDANLGQVLERGRLSGADAAQIGVSIASALETLHDHGFVHEHVEARNIFAEGESVKLRSDCIRETPEGSAGFEARRRDVRDLAVLLQEVLHGTPRTYTPRQTTLPSPFEDVVRNGMSGEWGLAEIKAALAPYEAAQVALASKQNGSATKHVLPAATPAASAAATGKPHDLEASNNSHGTAAQAESKPASNSSNDLKSAAGAGFHDLQSRLDFEADSFGDSRQTLRRWVPAGVLLAAVLLAGWIFLHRLNGSHAGTTARANAAVATSSATVPSATAVSSGPTSGFTPGASSAPRATSQGSRASQGKNNWRVVAFTYNREDQAQKKAASLKQRHPDLRPEVFTSTGRAPWLVTIGGALQRDAAYALVHKSASFGLPRDTYAQNYAAHR